MQFFLAKFYNIENVIKGMMMLASFYQEKPKSWRRLVYLKRFQVPTFERRSLKPEVTGISSSIQQYLGTWILSRGHNNVIFHVF